MNVFNAKMIDDTSLSDYMEASDFKIDDLWDELNKFIEDIKSPSIKAFLNKLLKDDETSRKYKTYPAAEFVHHSFRGGLLEHVLEMLNCAQPLRRFYPEANFDFITAGVILHDIGKLFELEPVGVAVQRTTEGYLIGHLIKSYEVVLQQGTELDENTKLNLRHIILSHHGLLEFGSPVLPATIEAVIVSYLDQLSSQTRIYQKVIRKNSENTQNFAEYDRIIGTKVYLGNMTKDQASVELPL
jgi:3'-5' exoribonuclease